jgi:hypothetical protein
VATIQDALREAIMNAFASAGAAGVDFAGSTLRRVGEMVFLGIGEAAFAPGSSGLLIEGQLVLKSAAEVVSTRPGAKLQLLARVVTDDLSALGIKERRKWGLLDDIGGAGRAIFGGSRELDPEVEKQARRLAEERLDSVEGWVVANTSLSRDRIVRKHWEGRAHDGDPGVMLRMQLRE